jgi:hypothetical protein
MPGQLLCRFAIVLWAIVLTLGTASAADVPPHLVGFAKSLVGQIDDADFAAAGDPSLSKRAGEVLRRARLRSWAGSSPKTLVDPGKFAERLGLDLTQEGHRAALDQLLGARDPAAQRSVLEGILRQARGPQTSRTLHEAEQSFRSILAEQLGSLQKRAKLEAGPGESVEIEWDPETSSVLARVNLGEGQGEVVLHGGAAGKIVNGELVYDVEADAAPVTPITPAKQAEINANVFGVWSGSDGAQWIIRGGGEIEAAASAKVDPAALALEQIDSARQQLAALEKDKVFIWVDPGGGEVIQKKFKRLGEPFRFDRARSENFHRDEIAALRERIAAAETELKLPPVKQHDPLGLKKSAGGKGRAIEIEVWQASGWRYLYDEASFDGKRLTASRTLRDARDISDLPDWVINGLVASWSPPEWIEFEAKFNPRDKSVSLEGLWWRLSVTYDPTYHTIESIHTPYSEPRVLQREHEKIMLRIVDLEGKSKEIIHHDEPFRLQARFTEAPDGEPQGLIKREGGDASVELALAGDGSDARLYESGILYARSVQYAKRNDPAGLFVKERFVDEDEFEAKTAEWRKLTGTSQPIAADLFEGNWKVSHVREGNGGSLSGAARVNAAGTSARLVLGDGTQLYQSTDMRALRGKDPDPHFLEINFERVEAFGDEPASAAPAPLPKGEIIYFPTLARSLGAELEDASASAGLDLKPVPEETINVLLKSRGPAHLAGGWHEVLGNGDHGHGGQQTWVRDIEISGVVVMEEQNKRSSPTTAYYPWGLQASAGSSPERTLFIFGKHLPTSAGDAVIFNSLTDGVSYHTPRFPNEMPQEKVDEAWRKAAAVPRRTIDETSAAPPSEGAAGEADVGLFVTARFEKGAEPGVKVLTLNEAPGLWLLDFADARGRAYFVDTPPIDGAPTDIFQSSDAGFLELELEAPIPYKEPLVFTMSKDGTAAGAIPLALLVGEGSEGREGRVYRSPPLHFFRSDRENWAPPDEAGAIKFDVAAQPGSKGGPDSKEDNRFTATWTEPLRLSVPKPAEMQIIDEDNEEMSELWHKALERAAACYGGKVKIDPRATSQENSNFILTELWSFRGPFKKAQITIGDHAAAILIRDEFVKFSRAVADGYAELGYESKLDEFIKAGVASAGRSDPLWKVMSNKTGGKTYTAEQMLDLDALAAMRKSSRDYAIAFRRDQVRTMAREYMHSILASTARATAAGDCKVDELLVIAGQPAPMIAARILPRLVTRKEEGGRTFWEPDVVARAYVRTLYIRGAELRALEEYANIDDTYKALALAAAGGGVAALASKLGYLGVAAYATVTADAIDMAYFGVKGVLDYQKGEAFYDFAKGASAVYGADYLEDAAAQRQSALGAAAGVLLPGIGIAGIPGTRFTGSLGDIQQLRRVEHGAEIARRFSKVDAASLAKLSDAERLDLLAYVDDIKGAARIAKLPEAVRKAAGLEKVGSAWELVKGAATSTGRRMDAADTKFLNAFDAHAANVQSQIKRGRDIATRLDDFEGPALNLLTKSERADLAEYVKNVQFREEALKSGDFGKSLAVPSAREAELARRFEEMTRVADAVTPSSAMVKADNLIPGSNPVTRTPGPDPVAAKATNDQPSLSPPPRDITPQPNQLPPQQPVRVDGNSARGPPVDTPAIAKPAPTPAAKPATHPPAVADNLPDADATRPHPAPDADSTITEPPPRAQPDAVSRTDSTVADNLPDADATRPHPAPDADSTIAEPPPRAQPDAVSRTDSTVVDDATDPNATTPHPAPVADATAPHPAPDPDQTVLLDMEMADAEFRNSSASKLDPDRTVSEPAPDRTVFEPSPAHDVDVAPQGSGKPDANAEAPPIAPNRADAAVPLDKTEDFPPPKDVDPANQPRAPPATARKPAPFDSTGLSDKIDTAPGYKFAKPAPDVGSIKGEETFFAGKAIEFPTSKMNKEGVREMRRIPGNIITSMGDNPDIELGNLIGQGAGASVFSSKADPTKVIRISEISADANAGKMVHYDMVGRYVGEALQRPDGNGFFRLTQTHGQFVTQDMSTKTKYLVTIEENIAHTGGGITNAADRFRITPPNPAQELTKALAIREMNRRGVVWTDHKLTNFDIIENPQSPTGYQMLIFDTGGIRPVTGQYVHERALTAEKVQRVFDQTPGRSIGKAFIEYFDEIMAASNYFDNRVFGTPPPNGDWSPIFSPNQINRQDGYYDLSMMRGDDLEDKASAQLGKDIRLPSFR